jgi:hypothetical protein
MSAMEALPLIELFGLEFSICNWRVLETMDESFPQWPALLFNFVSPSRSKQLLLNLWIADTHTTTPSCWRGRLKWHSQRSGLAKIVQPRSRMLQSDLHSSSRSGGEDEKCNRDLYEAAGAADATACLNFSRWGEGKS